MEPSVTDLETTALEGFPPVHGPEDDGECPCVHCAERRSRINAVRELARRADEYAEDKIKLHDWGSNWKRRARAAEADRDRLQAENADLINRLEISGELRKRAEAALDRLEWVDCDDLGRGHHVWTQSLPKPEDKCRCRSLTWAQANRAATDTPAPTDRDAA
jgi:1,4-alpha-glucan branching enzyme